MRVEATIGSSVWQTSIFPSAQHRSYLLPVRAGVRKSEKLVVDRLVRASIVVRRAW